MLMSSRGLHTTLLCGLLLLSPGAGAAAPDYGYITPVGSTVRLMAEDGERHGWALLADWLRTRALEAYENGEARAPEWWGLYRWADLFATSQGQAVSDWIVAIEAEGLGHAGIAGRYELPEAPLGDLVSEDLKAFLMGEAGLSQEFFELLAPTDKTDEVLRVLERLHEARPRDFRTYRRLAVALALVHDVAPPTGWPHGQVNAAVLPRRLTDALALFDYFVHLDESDKAAYDLQRLPVEYLRFLVDTPAQVSDLEWAARNVHEAVLDFEEVYLSVPYSKQRLRDLAYDWPHGSYALSVIRAEGGICVDQAYFAATAGKARGVPTLLFRGAGLDGRHAWFGYLRPDGGWAFDAGRTGENRYVTGLAHDPQSWGTVSDHELAFLAEGFRQQRGWELSRLGAQVAAEYLRLERPEDAIAAAERALRYERRNLAAWDTLYTATVAAGQSAPRAEAVLREAARAFREYPDLEAAFRQRVVAVLDERGQSARAMAESSRIARRGEAEGRLDIALAQAGDRMEKSLAEDSPYGQMRTFRVLLRRHGEEGGALFFDEVTRTLVEHLLTTGRFREAREVLEETRDALRVDANSQLIREIDGLIARLPQ